MWVNNEGRIVAKIGTGVDALSTSCSGTTSASTPAKPPTQRAAVQGFDAHKGMGRSELKRPDAFPPEGSWT